MQKRSAVWGAIFSLFKPNVKRPLGCLCPAESDHMHNIVPMSQRSSRGGLGVIFGSQLCLHLKSPSGLV